MCTYVVLLVCVLHGVYLVPFVGVFALSGVWKVWFDSMRMDRCRCSSFVEHYWNSLALITDLHSRRVVRRSEPFKASPSAILRELCLWVAFLARVNITLHRPSMTGLALEVLSCISC